MRETLKMVTASRMQNMVEILTENTCFVTILLFWKLWRSSFGASEGCFSDVRRPIRTNNPTNLKQNWCFFDFGRKIPFNPCSHIELNTPNPNPIFKFTISFTNHPKCQNTFDFLDFIFQKSKQKKKQTFILYFVLCINCIIHIL